MIAGEPEAARQWLEEAPAPEPAAPALNGRKAASVMVGDFDGGISEFRAAIARYPDVRLFRQRAPGDWTP